MKFIIALLIICFTETILFSYVFGSSTYKVAIVNNDATPTDGKCEFLNSCSFKDLSCRYIAHLKKQSITETYHSDLSSTVAALRNSQLDASAVVYLNENFTDAFVAKMALGSDADEETIKSAQIEVWLREVEQADSLQQYLQDAFNDFTQDLMVACGFTKTDNDEPRFSFRDPFRYQFIK